MSETIEELLASLTRKYEDTWKELERASKEADLLQAEIRGVRAAQNLLRPPSNGAEPPKQRRPRRDIKALVREYLGKPRTFTIPTDALARASFIANQIDCSRAQVRKALAALEGETP